MLLNILLYNLQSTSLVPAPLWFERSPEVMNYISTCSEKECYRKVGYELGFRFPPVMGKCVEQLIREILTKVGYQR